MFLKKCQFPNLLLQNQGRTALLRVYKIGLYSDTRGLYLFNYSGKIKIGCIGNVRCNYVQATDMSESCGFSRQLISF